AIDQRRRRSGDRLAGSRCHAAVRRLVPPRHGVVRHAVSDDLASAGGRYPAAGSTLNGVAGRDVARVARPAARQDYAVAPRAPRAGDIPPQALAAFLRVALVRDRIRLVPWTTRRSHAVATAQDRKSTRLNSSHVSISYAVFCLKKKKKKKNKELYQNKNKTNNNDKQPHYKQRNHRLIVEESTMQSR